MAPATGIKYSLDFTLNVNAPSIEFSTYDRFSTLPNFTITESNVAATFSLLTTDRFMVSLKEIFLFFLMVLIPETTSCANSNWVTKDAFTDFVSGHFEIIKASSGVRFAMYCQISSVKNGMNGCNIFKLFSNKVITLSNVCASMGLPLAGFTISSNQEQKSSQISL